MTTEHPRQVLAALATNRQQLRQQLRRLERQIRQTLQEISALETRIALEGRSRQRAA